MSTKYIIASMFVMALTTYVIRMLPMAIFRKKINDKRVQSFLYYVPYAVLSAMTFPAIFSSTGSEVSAVVGCVVAIVLAYMNRGLLTVAVGAAGAVFLVQMIGF
ncbi:MAG: AzlD domain-containing protein [Blautia faecicola]